MSQEVWNEIVHANLHPGGLLALALLMAWALDLLFGEPRNALHPVAWLGNGLQWIGRRLVLWPPRAAWCGGAFVWCVAAGLIGWGAWTLQAWLFTTPWWIAAPVLAVLLKPMFAWRMLRDEVSAVETALEQGEQPARVRLASLVSRDVSGFDAAHIRETAIETLAENLNDSLIAPLFWFVLLGLPGAALYRLTNTMDAMWGYRGRWEWAGKWVAVADDVMSWLPARITAALLRPTFRPSAWRALAEQARRTPSPNGGWPMGAMALRLNVYLTKPDVYVLNEDGGPPRARHLRQALQLASEAAWWGVMAAAACCAGRWA
ncbi:MAG: hypothetical protein RLZZ618_605 [Pseudomonadota bacterium]|jgi:adenosylcobinamide-phosphate synthase